MHSLCSGKATIAPCSANFTLNMGKIVGLLLLTLVFTISLDFTSGINDPAGFDRLMQRVIGIFREWAQRRGKEQFAAILMMDSESAWDDFEFQPTAMTVHTKTSRMSPDLSGKTFAPSNPDTNTNKNTLGDWTEKAPTKNRLANYIAALPKGNEHSEKRLLPGLLHRLYLAYLKKYKKVPAKIIFYSWAVPCWRNTCSSKCDTGCTDLVKDILEDYVSSSTQVVLAYTSLGGNMNNCLCDVAKTLDHFSESKVELVRVRYESSSMEDLEEVMIEGVLDVLLEE